MLRAKEILQIDATILAGILILLTLVFSSNVNLLEELEKDEAERTFYSEFINTPVAWIYGIGVFFSLSAVVAIAYSLKEEERDEPEREHYSFIFLVTYYLSIFFMVVGFLVFFYAFLQFGRILINPGG